MNKEYAVALLWIEIWSLDTNIIIAISDKVIEWISLICLRHLFENKYVNLIAVLKYK